MESKFMDATLNRPHGDRTIDAPYVFADLATYRKQLRKEDAWEKNDRNGITLFKTPGLTIVLTCLHKDAEIEEQTVEGILTIHVLEGSVEATVQGSTVVVKREQMLTIHKDIPHSIRARKDCTILLTNKSDNHSQGNGDDPVL